MKNSSSSTGFIFLYLLWNQCFHYNEIMRKTPRKSMKLLQCTLQWLLDEHTAFSSLLDIIWTTLLHSTVIYLFCHAILDWKVLKLCRTIRQVKNKSYRPSVLSKHCQFKWNESLLAYVRAAKLVTKHSQFRKQTEIFWKTTFRVFQRCFQSCF